MGEGRDLWPENLKNVQDLLVSVVNLIQMDDSKSMVLKPHFMQTCSKRQNNYVSL